MNIVIAQLNYRVGDLAANTKKIVSVINERGNDADMIVFSELAVTGYYPKDLLEREGFIDEQEKAIDYITSVSKGVSAAIVLGTVRRNPFAGKAFLNCLEVIQSGQSIYRYTKQLLPTYGVFDEARHFEPGNQPGLFEWQGKRIGFLICEDAWENAESPLYQRDPVALIAQSDVDLVININASPYNIYKNRTRYDIVSSVAQRTQAPVVYVNQVGGVDELVFDGGSMIVNKYGVANYVSPMFEEDIASVDFTNMETQEFFKPHDIKIISNQLQLGLRDYCAKSGFKQVVIGSSGGIDSAVTLAIAALALGPENVTAITMPSQYSSNGSVDDSIALCNALGIKLINSSIKDTFDIEIASYKAAFGEAPSPLAQENLQARIRGQRLMTYSNSTGAMVVSTGNKTELAVGYCTLYGDMAGGISLLGDLYKLQVYALAKYLNKLVFKEEAIPKAIIDKEPSAELAPDQLDSDALPDYEYLDAFLQLMLEGDLLSQGEREKALQLADNLSQQDKNKITSLVDNNEYKRRQSAPVIRINRRSFGADRQIPLTAKLTTI